MNVPRRIAILYLKNWEDLKAHFLYLLSLGVHAHMTMSLHVLFETLCVYNQEKEREREFQIIFLI